MTIVRVVDHVSGKFVDISFDMFRIAYDIAERTQTKGRHMIHKAEHDGCFLGM